MCVCGGGSPKHGTTGALYTSPPASELRQPRYCGAFAHDQGTTGTVEDLDAGGGAHGLGKAGLIVCQPPASNQPEGCVEV